MTNVIIPDNIIITINESLFSILNQYLNAKGNNIDIRFDLPEINSIQSEPTVSVFLYDIHEDLQLRSSEARSYDYVRKVLSPGWININCNYSITYWDVSKPSNDSSSPDSKPDNQAIQVMTRVLSALVNNRQLKDIPHSYTKVIPPQENFNSLGNFWQALGNRPRLSLFYSITVPMKLQDIEHDLMPVEKISSIVTPDVKAENQPD
ncbi:DUF4255 domain-containing protein [Xenorhabdus ishibashii]|uniref:Pvc16 N-terminal domain-containing protein n=1 Tax=Xenorhabdus ishibashii TaxID=1034471 RepID=A0A2D0KA95_9GAMM|nr:hypothetical protein Xish_03525 [Xenorhabdus ishibashii]